MPAHSHANCHAKNENCPACPDLKAASPLYTSVKACVPNMPFIDLSTLHDALALLPYRSRAPCRGRGARLGPSWRGCVQYSAGSSSAGSA